MFRSPRSGKPVKSVRVFDIVGQPVLVSRESARRIKFALTEGTDDDDGPSRLDFSGARGVAPSFLDEALLVAEECLNDRGRPNATVVFAHPPTVLASKHYAIARAHGRTLVETEAGDWEFRKA